MAATDRRMTWTGPTLTTPRWAGRSIAPEYLMPAGGKLDNSAFGAADANNRITVPSGTLVGRTLAERATNSPYGPLTAGDEDCAIVAYDVFDIKTNDDCELVRPYVDLPIKENYLPTVLTTMSSALQTLARARWSFTLGVN